MYFLRTSTSAVIDWSRYTDGIRTCLSRILGCALTPEAWLQATLPLKLGGLGLIDPAKLALPAKLGSLLFSADLLLKLGVDLFKAPYFLQKDLDACKLSLDIPVDSIGVAGSTSVEPVCP